jgi:hypothetical protein
MKGRIVLRCLLVTACVFAARADAPKDYSSSDFDGPVYHETEGFVIAEAEDAVLSSHWVLRTDEGGDNEGGCLRGSNGRPEGGEDGMPRQYRGDGYMRWEGGSQGVGHGIDEEQQYQGDREDWMVFRLFISTPGRYSVDLRCFHQERDGDNDCWIGKIGQDTLVYKFGTCHVRQYSWHDWDPDKATFHLDAGHQAVYVAGRSNGMGIDRVAIWRSHTEELFLSSHDPAASPTALYDEQTAVRMAVRPRRVTTSAWRVAAPGRLPDAQSLYDFRGRAVRAAGGPGRSAAAAHLLLIAGDSPVE